MKSLTRSSGSQTPLFSPSGWWSQVLFWRCFSLDPWSSLSREREGCLGGLLTARAHSGPSAEAEEQEGQGAGCWVRLGVPALPVAWILLCRPEGVKGAGTDQAWPSPSLPPPPPPVPFLWTSHPVFRFQPTYLSNLRGAFAGAGQAPSGPQPSTLALLLESPQSTALCVSCCSRPLPTPVPQWVLKGSPRYRPLQAPHPPPPHRLDSGAFPAWDLRCCPSYRHLLE